MEEEDLEHNEFLKALKARAPDLYKSASSGQLVICVPSAGTLHGLALNRATFQAHIIKASPFFAGIFETVDGKTLDFEDSVLETKQGFAEKRRVKVLFEELHYNSDFKPFRVLCIERPLQGGSQAAVDPARRSGAGISDCKTLAACQSLLEGLKLQDLSPLSQARFAIADLFRSYVIAKGYLDHAYSKLNAIFDSASNNLLESNRHMLGRLLTGEKSKTAWRRCVEAILMEDAHPKLVSSLAKLYHEEDERVASAIRIKAAASPSELGADERIECGLDKAIELMKPLDELKTPLDKISLLHDVANSINASVEDGKKKGTVPSNLTLSADDLLPLLIFVIIQACPQRVYTNAILLSYFGGVGLTGAEAGFHVANLMASADYLLPQGHRAAPAQRHAGIGSSSVAREQNATNFPGLFSPPHSSSAGQEHDISARMSAVSMEGGRDGSRRSSSGRSGAVETGGPGGRDALLEGRGRKSATADISSKSTAAARSWDSERADVERGDVRRGRGSGAPPPSVIDSHDDSEQLGDFLAALRSDDNTTSSGRGLPF